MGDLSPAYDLTFSLYPLLKHKRISCALSLNGKRSEIALKNLLTIADTYSIENPKGVIEEIRECINLWQEHAKDLDIPANIRKGITQQLMPVS